MSNDSSVQFNSSWKVSQTNQSSDDTKKTPTNAPNTPSFSKVLDQGNAHKKLSRAKDKISDQGSTNTTVKKKSAPKTSQKDENVSVDEEGKEDPEVDEKPFSFGRLQSKQDTASDSDAESSGSNVAQEGELAFSTTAQPTLTTKEQLNPLNTAATPATTATPVTTATPAKVSPLSLYSHLNVNEQAAVKGKVTGKGNIGKASTKGDKTEDASASVSDDKKPVSIYAGALTAVSNLVAAQEEVSAPVSKSADLQELISQLVDQLSTAEAKGQTDTTVRLQAPPLFAGATITLTAYANAPKEYNLSFSNLSPDARLLLIANQNDLMQTLAQKDYVVHILTVTTFADNSPNNFSQESRPSRDAKRDQGQGQGQGGRGQEQQDRQG